MSGAGRTTGSEEGERPPGGARRFAAAVAVTALVLIGSVAGLLYWMRATSRVGYDGPTPMKVPEHRPFR